MEFSKRRAAEILRGAARRLDPPTLPAAKTAAPKPESSAARTEALAKPAAPGTRVIAPFFDTYPRFYETSRTASFPDRLNARYDAIFAENADLFDGASVLDIASHDGRWTLAALATGARFVTGIEGRPDLVTHAATTLQSYGFGADRYDFVVGDIFDVFDKQTFDVDVVLCLGFMYHTMRYHELWDGMVRANPSHIIIDTQARAIVQGAPAIYVGNESFESQNNAIADKYTRADRVLTGRPNLGAIKVMAESYGYELERLSNWPAIIRDNPAIGGIGNYKNYSRATMRLKRRA